jgi:hypothetical protein
MPDAGASRKRPICGRRITPAFSRSGSEPRPSVDHYIIIRYPLKLTFECGASVICAVPWDVDSEPPAFVRISNRAASKLVRQSTC